MTQQHVDLPPASARSTPARPTTPPGSSSLASAPAASASGSAAPASAAAGRAPRGLSVGRPSAVRAREPHVVVATQTLPRMGNVIRALIQAGYSVTAYASPTRLLPRLHRMGSPVALLVIDGGLAPAFARAAAIAARATYAYLPIILLASPQAARHTEFMPPGVTVLPLPLADTTLLATAAALASRGAEPWCDGPPDAA